MLPMTIKPDLQTRESVMVAAGRVQLAVTDAEGTRYIKIEAKYKADKALEVTFRDGTTFLNEKYAQYVGCTLEQASHVFISEKGYGTQSLGTYYPPKPGQIEGRFFEKTGIGQNHPHIDALMLAVGLVNGMRTHESLQHVTITAESQCGLCGRKLEDPESVRRGIGPECARKPTGTKILHASAFNEQLAMETDDSTFEHIDNEGNVLDSAPATLPADDPRNGYFRLERERLQRELGYAEAEIARVRREMEKLDHSEREVAQEREAMFHEHRAELAEAAQS